MSVVPPVPVVHQATAAKSSLRMDFHRVEVLLTVALTFLPQILALINQGVSHHDANALSGLAVAAFTIAEGIKDAASRTHT